jgi:penicillin G amidase
MLNVLVPHQNSRKLGKIICFVMKIVKVGISLIITISLVYFLNRGWNFGAPIPPLGKFLDPFHGFWQNAETGKVKDQTLSIKGLKDDVTIIYDSLLIPHIFARNDEDLFLTQGYVTAQHRLWQMEFQTMAAAGRISEILGGAALDYDRGQRRLGMTFGAENNLKDIEKDKVLLNVVDSYTAGVNAYIQSLSYEDLPFEYKLLDYEPEPWSNLKMGMVQMNFSQTLNSGEKDLQLTNALKVFGKETLDLLYPDHEEVADPIVTNAGNWNFVPITLDSIASALPDELVQLKAPEEKPRGIGSNNWVVGGKKTATGFPILSNDPHLTLGIPSLWFVIHLNSPSVNTMGGSLAGAPAVILGFNDSIAWGCTNAQRDVVDWYRIQFKDKSKREYLSDGNWIPSQKRIEKIDIKGGTSFTDTVTYTHHGPVRFDENYHTESEKNHFAFRWLSHDGSEPLKSFYLLNRAKNHRDYMVALDHHFNPAQNFVFGAVDGDIAIRVQGKYPVRRKDEGKFILDGSKTSSEWKAFIPFEQNVMIKNPETGFLFSANQYPVDATYPYYIQSGDYYETYRNRRISQVLAASTQITPADMMKLQNDNFNMQAAESLPMMLSYLDSVTASSDEQKTISLLKSWDYFNSIESVPAIYYEEWWNELYASIWDEMKESKVSMSFPSEFNTIKLMKEQPDLYFFDNKATSEKESLSDIIRNSFKKAIANVEEWKSKHSDKTADWASYKDTYVQHLTRIEPLGFHARNGGNSSIVNASSHRWGPSWRMIVSLEKSGVKAWGVYPGGQSGNPGSPFYGNLMEAWEKAEPYPLKFVNEPSKLASSSLFTTTLKPASK